MTQAAMLVTHDPRFASFLQAAWPEGSPKPGGYVRAGDNPTVDRRAWVRHVCRALQVDSTPLLRRGAFVTYGDYDDTKGDRLAFGVIDSRVWDLLPFDDDPAFGGLNQPAWNEFVQLAGLRHRLDSEPLAQQFAGLLMSLTAGTASRFGPEPVEAYNEADGHWLSNSYGFTQDGAITSMRF